MSWTAWSPAWRTSTCGSPARAWKRTKKKEVRTDDRQRTALGGQRVRRLPRASEEPIQTLLGLGNGLGAVHAGDHAQHRLLGLRAEQARVAARPRRAA